MAIAEQSRLWPADSVGFRDVFFAMENTTSETLTNCQINLEIRDAGGQTLATRTTFGDYLQRVAPGERQYMSQIVSISSYPTASSVHVVAAGCFVTASPANRGFDITITQPFTPSVSDPNYRYMFGTVLNRNGGTAEQVRPVIVCGAGQSLAVFDTTFGVTLAENQTASWSIQRHSSDATCSSVNAVIGDSVSLPVTPSPTTTTGSTSPPVTTPPSSPTGSGLSAVGPERVFDTRVGGVGLRSVPKVKVGGGYVLEVQVTDLPGLVPRSGVGAVSMNVTVTEPDGSGYLTIYPCGQRRQVSSLNFSAGQTVPNAVIAPVSASGTICIFSTTPTHVLADINGWFAT